jgi:hypothetical protein
MRRIKKTIKVSREHAVELAMKVNGVSRLIAERYTDSELREVLTLLDMKADF